MSTFEISVIRFHFSNTACKLLKTVKTLVIEERFCFEKKKGFSLKYYFLDRSPQSDKQDGADRLHRILTISIDHPAISRRSRRTNPRSARGRDFSRRSVTCKCRGRLAKSTSESGSLVNEKTRDLWCTWSLNTSLVFLRRAYGEKGIRDMTQAEVLALEMSVWKDSSKKIES